MRITSESRVVLSARGHALGIHNNLLLHQWPYTPPSDDDVAETFEAILGAVYLDSGNSIEAVKKVITQTELNTHKLLKANAQSQNKQKRRELTTLRLTQQKERGRFVAAEAFRRAEAAALVTKQAAEQAKRQLQEGDTTTEGQTQNEPSETAQTETRSEDHTVLTYAEASQDLADFLIRYKTGMKEKERCKTDKLKSQVPNEESPSENRDQACIPTKKEIYRGKPQRRTVAAASELSKECNPLDDVSEHDGTTSDSRQQRSPVSRVGDQNKVDALHKSDNQDTQTPLPEEGTTSKAEDQLQQKNNVSTATTEDILISNPYRFPVEAYADLGRGKLQRRRRAWRSAVSQSIVLREKGIDRDVRELYEWKLNQWHLQEQGEGLSAPNAPNKVIGGYVSREEWNGMSQAERSERKAERRHQRNIRGAEMRARNAAFRETKGYEEGPAKVQHRNDTLAQLKPNEETTQAPASLLLEPPTAVATIADFIPENMSPASITAQHEIATATGSGEADTVTSTVPASTPTQELSSSLKKTDPLALKASQQETFSPLWSGKNGKVPSPSPSPAPAPVIKFSSSPRVPGRAKSTSAASNNRNKPNLELSSYLEEIGFMSASTTHMDDDKEIQVRTKNVDQLERDILSSHKAIWQAVGTAEPFRQRKKRITSARRSLRDPLILAKQLTGRTPANRTATSEEDVEPKNWMQGRPQQAGTDARPFVRFDFYESDTERFMANITQDDSGAPDTSRPESGKKSGLTNPSVRRIPGTLRVGAKSGELPSSKSKPQVIP
jgi:hypothetical protein